MRKLFLFLVVATLVACSSSNQKGSVFKKSAEASYYADKFNGRKTASGATFSNYKLTAAHRKLPFGTKLKIINLANDQSVIVEVNDRGPFKRNRELDLSKKAFMQITDNKNHGILRVKILIVR